jgi:hypothetical protein
MQHGVMLGSWTHGNSTQSANGAKNCMVIAFGSATGEHHFARLAAKCCGNKIACFVKGFACLAGKTMRTGRVRIHTVEVRGHCLNRFGAHWRARCVIEIRTHAFRLRHHF